VKGLKLDWLELGPKVNVWVDHPDLKTGKSGEKDKDLHPYKALIFFSSPS
jgi:hypothetical protein